jgi:hypothetical protein
LRRERFAKVRARPANAEDVATLAKQEVEFLCSLHHCLILKYFLLLTTELQEGRRKELSESFAMRRVNERMLVF